MRIEINSFVYYIDNVMDNKPGFSIICVLFNDSPLVLDQNYWCDKCFLYCEIIAFYQIV